VHLQRLDLKVPVIAAIWTSQRQNQFPLPPLQAAAQRMILCGGCLPAQREIGRKTRICAKIAVILLLLWPMTTTSGAYQIHTEARGPHWIAWVTRGGDTKPDRSIVLVAASRPEAEERARRWAEQTQY
jgi:hypothetical protein